MNIKVKLSSAPIAAVVTQIVQSVTNNKVTDFETADLVLTDDAASLLKALKAGKRAVQFTLNSSQAATGLLNSEFADRVHIFAPSEDQRDNLTWLDDFVAFLTSLTTPAESGKE